MDNLTHTLIGVTVANAGLKQKFGKGTTLALAITSNLPDLDIFWGFFHSGEAFMYRRMLTHSIAGLPLLAVAFAFIYRRFYPNLSIKAILTLAFTGLGLHVFFDLVNSYGVLILYPISQWRASLGWTFIIDLVLWLLMFTPLLVWFIPSLRANHQRTSTIALRSVIIYVLFCGVLRYRSASVLNSWIIQNKINAAQIDVYPEAFGPQRFRGVVREGNDYLSVLVYGMEGRVEFLERTHTQDEDPEVRRILQTPDGQKIDRFFKSPVWTRSEAADESQSRWIVRDLQFRSAIISRLNPFVYEFNVSEDRIEFLGPTNNVNHSEESEG